MNNQIPYSVKKNYDDMLQYQQTLEPEPDPEPEPEPDQGQSQNQSQSES